MQQQDYVIEGGRKGKERLNLLSATFGPGTGALLDRVAPSPGQNCLDVGCGGGHVARELAGRVGPEGRVLGIDFDAEVIRLAAEDAKARGVGNVSFQVGDVLDLTLPGGQDLVYARFLLTHLTEPDKALGAMVEATRPGGVVVVEDIDMGGHFAHPPNAAFDAFLTLYRQAVHLKGADPDIGRRLPSLFRAAGLTDIQIGISQIAHENHDCKWLTPITLDRIAPAALAAGLATEEELREIGDNLRAAAENPEIMIVLPRIFQVWGRRPA